jgi:HAD superfamily hydrolase (TIGR01509 family)
MIKAIFWDNDGVLVDTEHLYFKATKQILAAAGIDLTKEIYINLFLTEGKGAWHLAAEKGISQKSIRLMREDRNNLYSRLLCEETKVIDGVENVLKALYGKLLMGIVTSSHRDHFEIIHQSSGLLKYFDFVLAREDYLKSKPDPEPYRLAVEKSGFRKEECIAIEDSERGLISAKAAGIPCIIIPSKLTASSDFSQADKILANVTELTDELIY